MHFIKNLRKGFIFALLSSFLTACVVVNTRALLIGGENPLNIASWVILFTALPWLFLFSKHSKEFVRLSKRNIFLLIFIGIAASVGVNYMQSLALAHSSAINFSFLYRTVIVFTIIFAWLFFKEKITWHKGVLIVFIMIGSYLVATDGQALAFSLGDIYTLLMSVSAALVYNILLKHSISKMHHDLSGSVTSLVACISLVTLALVTHVFAIPQNLGFVLLGGTIYFTSTMLRNRAYKYSTASLVTMTFAMTPLFVTILSAIFLHETLSPIEAIGGAVIIGAALLAEKVKV